MSKQDRRDTEQLGIDTEPTTPQKLLYECELWMECPVGRY